MQERRQLCFDQAVTHFNMVADAATNSKKEMFVATRWSWQNDLAAYGDVQLLQPGDIVLPDEQDMTDRIALMAAERRLQRVATYRQLQAYSNILHQATGGRLTLIASGFQQTFMLDLCSRTMFEFCEKETSRIGLSCTTKPLRLRSRCCLMIWLMSLCWSLV